MGCLAWMVTATCAVATEPSSNTPLSFERLGLRDGLSQSTVMDLHQDRFGFIWLATENGLNRYDGHDVRTYFRQAGQTGGLPSDYIWAVEEDESGNLWLGTDDAGVVHWDRAKSRFRQISLTGARGENLSNVRVNDLLIASDGMVWVGTRDHGVLAVTPEGRTTAQLLFNPSPQDTTRHRAITTLAEATDGSIWVGSQHGVHRIHRPSNLVASYRREDAAPLDDRAPVANNVSRLLIASDGIIWIATYGSGISQLDPATGKFQHLRATPDSPVPLPSNRVRALLEDRQGRLWIGTQAGLALLFPDGRHQIVRHEPANQFSLPNDYIMSLDEDESGLIWVGTRGGGAAIWNPRSLSLGPHTPESLSGIHVNAFLERPDSGIWIGTIGRGLLSLDANGDVTPVAVLDQVNLTQNSVMALFQDSQDTIWIGTLADGLLRYDPAAQRIESIPTEPTARNAIGAPGIMALAEGPPGTLWVGTYNGGVAKVDTQTLEIDRLGYTGPLAGLERARATTITVVDQRTLWFGTEANGLVQVDLNSGAVKRHRGSLTEANQLPSDTIYSLHATDDGDLWIGTGAQGLARLAQTQMNRSQPKFEVFSTADGLSSNVIFGIQADQSGRLWLSSNNGLMRLSPASRDLHTFHEGQGSFSNEFNFGAHYRTREGTLYFGGPGGFNAIDPTSIDWNLQPPRVVLSGILLFGEPVTNGPPAYLRRSLTLQHDQDVLAFEFAATDYTAPERNIYSVKLEGFDREWSTPSTRNRATYTNLDPGRYTLKIRAANSDRVWASAPYELAIEIRHPPWATWWAWLAYVAIAGSLLWLFLRLRFRAQERDARLNQLAYYDRITGLPNRDLFEQRGAEALRRIEGSTDHLVVLCIRFAIPKQIGQSLPRDMANDMWSSLAAQLVRAIHSHEHAVGRGDVARLDADQFVIFMRIAPEQDDLAALTERLKAGWSEGLVVGEHRVSVAAAIGVARAPEHARDIGTLVHYAVTAATAHSSPQPGQVAIYDDEMTSRLESRLLLETRLRQAIAQDELELYLQPKFTRERQIVGAEALLRWNSRELGWIPPSTFVPLAEESDLIQDLDAWVIHKTCALLKAWDSPKLLTLRIAINLSAANLNQAHTVRALVQATASAGIDPARIEVELTESALLSDVEQTRDTLRELKEAGFSIALDDFGTGYSSLTHLKSFAIDTVKIDREFVQGVDQAGQEQSICSAIVALARSLGLTTVAEGVETEAQFQTLVGLGCDDIQGYLLAKPMPTGEFRQLVENTAVHEAG